MADDTKKLVGTEAKVTWSPEALETVIRERIRATIEAVLEAELDAALGAGLSARVGDQRRGYRHGTRTRTLTTSTGPTAVEVPRARLREGPRMVEWRSETLPRYQRRTARVDEAILGVYLAGGNSRRIRGALAPLLRGGPLSKDAVSRLVGRLAADFETWQQRDLADDAIRYLLLDGWYPKVRLGKRRVRVPVLVTMGVRADGQRVVMDMRLVGDESTGGLAGRRAAAPGPPDWHASAGRHRRQSWAGDGAARGVARDRDPAVHGPQAAESDRQGAGPRAGSSRGRLPPRHLCGDRGSGAAASGELRAEVAAAVPGRRPEL